MAQAKRHGLRQQKTVAVMIPAEQIEYLAQLCLNLHEQEGAGYAVRIDLLLEGLSREKARAVACASVDLFADGK
jgi:hypothetical protein